MKKLSLLIVFICTLSTAQNKDKELYIGNEFFSQKEYVDAETAYRISSSKNENKKAISSYNLGTSIYNQDNPEEAKIQFQKTIELAKTKAEKHKAYHNLGNVFMAEKNYQQAAEAYKNALRNNPYDEETRYNYAVAKKHNKENPPNRETKEGDDDKNNGNNSNQIQDKKDQEKARKGNDKDKKDSDKGNEDQNKNQGNNREDKNEGDKDEDKNGNPKPTGANKQQIENLLEAVNNAEKKIQDKLNAKQVKSNPVKTDKDW